MVSYMLPLLFTLSKALPVRNNNSEKRSTKELQNTTPVDASSFCKSAYFINNGTKIVGIFENEICRFDLEINECDDIRFNQGAMFYRGIDQNGMCFFSQEDGPVQSEPSLSPLSKPKESIETRDDGPVSNLTDAAYQIYYHLEHLLNIDYYDEETDY